MKFWLVLSYALIGVMADDTRLSGGVIGDNNTL